MSGFSNPLVGGGGALVYPSIHSPDYVAGSAGWTINKDGTVEFNNGTFRGIITAATFEGNDFVINSLGAFFYSGTPATGNLIASVTPASGSSDGHGNAYLEGVTCYTTQLGSFYAVSLLQSLGQSGVFFYQATGSGGPWTYEMALQWDFSGNLYVQNGSLQVPAGNVNVTGNVTATGHFNLMGHIANTTTSYSTSGIGTISGTPTAAEYNALNTAYNATANALNTYAGKFNTLLSELQAQGYMS